MCAFGAPSVPEDAVASGIADRIIEGDLLTGALALRAKLQAGRVPGQRPERLKDADPAIFAAARGAQTRRGQTAPLVAIDAVEAASKLPFEEGMRYESELFENCRRSTQSKAQIHAFFGERTVAKIPDIPSGVAPLAINQAAIIGAGTMGGGIAMAFADAGIPVLMKEREQQALDRGMNAIRKITPVRSRAGACRSRR
jgi:3-hydroxyacyl-CoA dehydrogenase